MVTDKLIAPLGKLVNLVVNLDSVPPRIREDAEIQETSQRHEGRL